MVMEEKIEVFKNSPVEFILIGPRGGRDEILIRSDNAGLDIVGLAVEQGIDRDFEVVPISMMSLILGGDRQMNIVESRKVHDLEPDSDDRVSSYQFAWVGLCSSMDREKVKDVFHSSIADLRSAIQKGSRSQVEMAISRIVLKCSSARERRLRSRRFIWVSFLICAAVGIGALI
jgi:hypothetical protein